MFHFPWCRSEALLYSDSSDPDMTRDGLPHSEISGSKRVCRSPRLIAAYHVLHRLLMPRHPSCALMRLTKKSLVFSSRSCLPFSMQLSKNKPACAGNHVVSRTAPDCRRSPDPASASSALASADMVGVPGIEPGTSSLSGTRSNQLSYTPDMPCRWLAKRSRRAIPLTGCPPSPLDGLRRGSLRSSRQLVAKAGGGNRVRTGDPELAKLVLCQLSYAPIGIADFRSPIADLNRKSSIRNRQSTCGITDTASTKQITHDACVTSKRKRCDWQRLCRVVPARHTHLAAPQTIDHRPYPPMRRDSCSLERR